MSVIARNESDEAIHDSAPVKEPGLLPASLSFALAMTIFQGVGGFLTTIPTAAACHGSASVRIVAIGRNSSRPSLWPSDQQGDEHAGDIAPDVLGGVLADGAVAFRRATRKAGPVMGLAVKRYDLPWGGRLPQPVAFL
jgi:hypothetical protein